MFDYDNNTCKLFADNTEKLLKAKEVDDIFILLNTEYASFLNYDIFMLIIERYNLNEGQEEFDYPGHLQEYINTHNISDFVESNPSLVKHTDVSKEVTLLFDIQPTYTLAKVKDLLHVIADRMNLRPCAIRIVSIGEGSVAVTLLIPASVADAIFISDDIFTASEKETLLQSEVLWLKCNGYTYYFSNVRETYQGTPAIQVSLLLCSKVQICCHGYGRFIVFFVGQRNLQCCLSTVHTTHLLSSAGKLLMTSGVNCWQSFE